MLIGLGIIAFMSIKFGKVGAGLRKHYTITAEFPNASGLLKGADIYLAGAPVGSTGNAPELIEGKYAVRVQLKLKSSIKIPRGSSFTIKSAGVLGDVYVSIDPPPEPKPGDVFSDGDYVIGTRLVNLDDLASKGGDVMDELKKRLQELEGPLKDIKERLFSDKNLKNLEQSFADIHEITASLKETTKGIDEVIEKAKGATDTVKETVSSAKSAIGKVDSAAGDLKGTLADFRKMANTATKTLESAQTLFGNATHGKGSLGLLLSDKETAENLKIFISNLRDRGVLWYKNRQK